MTIKENVMVVEETVLVSADVLRNFVRDVFVKLGVPADDAYISADVLVKADLRGIESHGVGRLSRYVDRIRTGLIEPVARISVVRETPSSILLDGGNGLGQVVSYQAMQRCIKKAKGAGTGWVAVRNSNHFGIAGYYAMMTLEHNMLGLCFTNSRPLAVPTYGRESIIGTNPISFAAPCNKEKPFVLDMATTVVPIGKIEVAQRKSIPLPLGWAVDNTGTPTTDPNKVLKGGGILPLGGRAEFSGYKGYGLSVMIDILCAVLTGANYLSLIERPVDGKATSSNIGHFFGAISIDGFRNLDEFTETMDNLIGMLKNSAKEEGETRIFVAGEREFEKEEEHLTSGIPLYKKTFLNLKKIGDSVGIALSI
jgi:LDH2 family malate/lactate/ureidoglycolate dehydrogenase